MNTQRFNKRTPTVSHSAFTPTYPLVPILHSASLYSKKASGRRLFNLTPMTNRDDQIIITVHHFVMQGRFLPPNKVRWLT